MKKHLDLGYQASEANFFNYEYIGKKLKMILEILIVYKCCSHNMNIFGDMAIWKSVDCMGIYGVVSPSTKTLKEINVLETEIWPI